MASAYRTVSESDVMVIAEVILVALLAKERKFIYRRKGKNLRDVVTREESQRTLTEWQLSWQNEIKSRRTTRLIDNFDPWLNLMHGEIDYFLIQLLSEHEGFESYLYKIGKARSPDCVFCNGALDDEEDAFFLYIDRWELFPDSIVRERFRSAGRWTQVAHYVQAEAQDRPEL